MATRTALVTGGAGYIGSHTCVELLAAGWRVVVVDDLSNSSAVALDRVRALAPGDLRFHQVELNDADGLRRAFADGPVDAVVHFAGKKAVGESVAQPLTYYRANVAGTVTLLEVMAEHGVH